MSRRGLASEGGVAVPPARRSGKPARDAEGRQVSVRTHYMVGNHDWFFHPVTTAVNNWFIRHRGLGFACVTASVSVGGMIKPVDKVDESDGIWAAAEECLTRALNDLETMRGKEGDFIEKDLLARLISSKPA